MPVWRERYPGVEDMHVAVMGCVVNGPGEMQARQHRHQPAGLRRAAGRAGVRGRREDRDAQGRRHRRGVPAHRRRLRAQPPTARAPAAAERSQHAARSRSRPLSQAVAEVMSNTIQAVRGMNDILPDEAALWERFEETRARLAAAATATATSARRCSSTPHLFRRAIGEVTDIVEKEMYTFDDELNGEHLTLRPEATASMRARGDRAQPALRRAAAPVVHRADVPPRAAAEGPLPPVPPGRRRGAGLRRSGHRCRADADVRAAVGRPRARRTSSCSINSLGSPEERRAPSRGAGRVPAGARGRAGRGCAGAACTPIRCACSTARIPRCRR